MDLGLTGKRALVLASSRGLGGGIARALAAEGAHVLLTGRSAAELEAAAAEITAAGPGRADFVTIDLMGEGVVETLIAAASEKLGGVDILINNTGGPPPGSAASMTAEQMDRYFRYMVLNLIDLGNRLLPAMVERGWGRILTVASSGILEPIANLALSNTLRPALAGWSKTLATEVAAKGVTVNMLLPGSILTSRLDVLDNDRASRTGRTMEDVRAEAEARIPAGRYGRVEEFAATAAFLVSEKASYVTGSMIRCDGGANRSV